MEKIKVILLILALMGTATATTILVSNDSAEYEICVTDGLGKEYGCANNTDTVAFSRIDPVLHLKLIDADYTKNPASLLDLVPTLIYIGVFVLIAIIFSYIVLKVFVTSK